MSERRAITAAVLTVSDRCSRGEAEDTAGPAVRQRLVELMQADVVHEACIADDLDTIVNQLAAWAGLGEPPDVIMTTGGTGLSPRDVTPEATRRVIDREHAGLITLMQMRCYEKTPKTFLSRGVAGVAGRSLIINLPGSQRGAVESLEAIADVLPHAVAMLHGGGH